MLSNDRKLMYITSIKLSYYLARETYSYMYVPGLKLSAASYKSISYCIFFVIRYFILWEILFGENLNVAA